MIFTSRYMGRSKEKVSLAKKKVQFYKTAVDKLGIKIS
jgi:hypothetical protein